MKTSITDRTNAGECQSLTIAIFEILNQFKDYTSTLIKIVGLIKDFTGFDAVGIRLRKANDFPYYEVNGFSKDFVRDENFLCSRNSEGEILYDSNGDPLLECLCGIVLSCRTDPSKSYFTQKGSFFTNRATQFFSTPHQESFNSYIRNSCCKEGYESVALIPLRTGDQVVGLLQLNDARKDQLNLQTINFLEGVGSSIGISLERQEAKEIKDFERGQLLSIFNGIDEPVYVSDPNSYEILFVNNYLKDLLGKDPTGRLCFREFQNSNRPCDFCTNDIILKNKSDVYKWEYYNPVLKRHFEIFDRLIRWPDGRDVRFELAFDITERKLLEEKERKEALSSAAAKTAIATIEAIPEGIVLLNNSLMVISVNPALKQIIGYPEDELVGKYAGDLIHVLQRPEDMETVLLALKSAAQGMTPHSLPDYFVHKKGHEIPVIVTVSSIKNPDNHLANIVVTVKDMSEHKRVEKEKEELETQLRHSQEMKILGQLASGVAHEVRNPLNAIMAISEALFKRIGDNNAYQQYMNHIKDQIKKLTRLMEELLTLGRPVREIDFGEISVADLVSGAVTSWQQVSEHRQKRINLLPLMNAEKIMVNVDIQKLQQVFINLLDNSEHHMRKKDKITIKILKQEYDFIQILFCDTGTGIPQEDIPHIFEPFFTTRKSGTGLGLSIVKNIVENHGGRIQVYNNDPPPGLTVKIGLPCIETRY